MSVEFSSNFFFKAGSSMAHRFLRQSHGTGLRVPNVPIMFHL